MTEEVEKDQCCSEGIRLDDVEMQTATCTSILYTWDEDTKTCTESTTTSIYKEGELEETTINSDAFSRSTCCAEGLDDACTDISFYWDDENSECVQSTLVYL